MPKQHNPKRTVTADEHKQARMNEYRRQLESLQRMIQNELDYMQLDGIDFEPSASIKGTMGTATECNNDISTINYFKQLGIIPNNTDS